MDSAKSVPQFSELINPTLFVLRELGGSGSITEIVDKIIDHLGLSDEVADLPHGEGSSTEIAYRGAWARTYLKKYGLLENSARGVWSLTSLGRETESVDPK